jgi:hypothetical protein
MKRIATLLLLAVVLLAVGCASGPAEKSKPKVAVAAAPEYQIIDHKTRDFGGTPPDWVTKSSSELEQTPKYKEFYVFVDDQIGKDLEGLKLWARGFSISSQIARIVSNRVEDKFVGAAAGDRNSLETYMEEVVKSTAAAQYSGARIEEDFWVKRRKVSDKSEDYRYLFLVTVPRKQIDDAIGRALKDADQKAKPTPDKETAIKRVKDSFNQGL